MPLGGRGSWAPGPAQRVRPFACTASSGSSDVAVGRSYSLTFSLLSLDTRLTPEAITTVRKQHIQSPGDWVRYHTGARPLPAESVLSTADWGTVGLPAAVPLCLVAESPFRGGGCGSAPGSGSALCSRTGLWRRFGEQHRRRPKLPTQRPALPSRGRGRHCWCGAGRPRNRPGGSRPTLCLCHPPLSQSGSPWPHSLLADPSEQLAARLWLRQQAPAFLAPGAGAPVRTWCLMM